MDENMIKGLTGLGMDIWLISIGIYMVIDIIVLVGFPLKFYFIIIMVQVMMKIMIIQVVMIMIILITMHWHAVRPVMPVHVYRIFQLVLHQLNFEL